MYGTAFLSYGKLRMLTADSLSPAEESTTSSNDDTRSVHDLPPGAGCQADLQWSTWCGLDH
jgi:hypothetical protein